jgi:membrane-bound inhibitor of C-type lysozyme
MLTRYLLTLAALVVATPAFAQEDVAPVPPAPPTAATASSALTLTLESMSDIERTTVNYQCDNEQALSVQYINAAPNFLALVPVDDQTLVFATTISASGARYVSGPYEWWSHQGEGTLRDLMQDEDADPLVTCTAVGNTP